MITLYRAAKKHPSKVNELPPAADPETPFCKFCTSSKLARTSDFDVFNTFWTSGLPQMILLSSLLTQIFLLYILLANASHLRNFLTSFTFIFSTRIPIRNSSLRNSRTDVTTNIDFQTFSISYFINSTMILKNSDIFSSQENTYDEDRRFFFNASAQLHAKLQFSLPSLGAANRCRNIEGLIQIAVSIATYLPFMYTE